MQSSDRVNPFINRQPLETGGRAVFMRRLRENPLGHDVDMSPAPTEAPPAGDEGLVRQCGAGDPELRKRWVERARGNSMVVHEVGGTRAAVQGAVEDCFAPHTIGKVIVNMGNAENLGGRFELLGNLSERGMESMVWGSPGCREAAFTCDAAITDCRAGLADAGSLLVWANGGFGRSSTLVVPVHVVLLPASRILPDFVDGLALPRREHPELLPSNIVVINGPSKTADIEMNLITGVHGPKFLYVILIDGI